ncbi:S1-C subfamily serine protease [Constrictibacter sp. MBR-5]|jgi:S1-C subfamily serine protease|uniref:S1C family serine protease n=1 Tax=Constrictibacter sp. MBR-5 TaxID=3156467 RepID=UPI00339AEC1F
MRRIWVLLLGLMAFGAGAPGAAAQLTPERILPAVVGVEAETVADARSAATLGTTRQASGVVIDGAGLVLTIGFAVMEAERVSVLAEGGKRLPARVIAYHSESGLGLLRVPTGLDASPLRLGDSTKLATRDPVLIVAYGGADSAQPALVVSKRPFAGSWEYLLDSAIYTSPPHPLWTGAALIDGDGRLVGIGYLQVADAVPDTVLPGNMFVPVDLLKPILADLLAEGRESGPRRPWLGLYTDETKGRLIVERVAADGPAAAAGLKPGDIVLGVAGQPVRSLEAFYRALWSSGSAGTEVELTVLKDLTPETVRVRSADRYGWLRKPQSF